MDKRIKNELKFMDSFLFFDRATGGFECCLFVVHRYTKIYRYTHLDLEFDFELPEQNLDALVVHDVRYQRMKEQPNDHQIG